MIEVEIRGRLSESELEKLDKFLKEHGEHIESHEREMILLTDYPGYSKDFVSREVDIRLRNTNGKCEIMLKRKVSDQKNHARSEVSLSLNDHSLDTAKEVVKALGCSNGILMQRSKEVYSYQDIEWSLVKTPKGHYFYEAEIETDSEAKVPEAREKLTTVAADLDLEVLNEEETRKFIQTLDLEVNEEITL